MYDYLRLPMGGINSNNTTAVAGASSLGISISTSNNGGNTAIT
jgi:hypothetical protein